SIFGKPTEMMMTTKVLANRIFLDQTIVQRQVDGKLVDLQMFIRTGIVCDYTFLQTLYRNFPSKKQLENTAFTALVEPVTIFYQNFEEEISNFGKIFETAFYLTENGHLLSESMKRFFGLLFHLFWAIQWSIEDFQIENFLKWLHRLGFPIFLPRQISLAEYLQNVLKLQEKDKELVTLEKIGTIGESKRASERDLLQAAKNYQKICSKI